MKNILPSLIFLLIIQNVFSQSCTVTGSSNYDTIVCGDHATLSAYGRGQGIPVFSENFNTGGYGPGWSSTTQASFNNPCGPNTVDGTTYIWMGNSSPVPRILTTSGFNLSSCTNAGVTLCFDMRYAVQGEASPCEGPDEPQEGVYIQYSIDNGATWVTITYFDPNGGYDPTLTNWNNHCIQIPTAALTANAKFRWFQDNDSGADYDHWGIDNVVIYCNDPTFNIVWQHDMYNLGPSGGVDPNVVSPRTTTNYYVVMSNGTVSCRDTVQVFVKNPTVVVNAGADTSVCTGTCAQIHATAKVVKSPAKQPTYTDAETATVSGTPGFPGFPPIVPATPGIASLSMNINVTGLNQTTVGPGLITGVCIGSLNMQLFAGINIFDIYLICPSGDSIRLVPDSTLTGNNLTNTCFVPGGGNIASAASPYTGSYAPAQPFSNLNGCNSNGVWTLHLLAIYNSFSLPTGSFNSWSISFNDPEISYTGNFNWSPTTNMTGSTTLTPTVCPTGASQVYTITMSDTANCATNSDAVTISTHTCCSFGIGATAVQPTCNQSNGSINLNITPLAAYTYHWSGGSSASSLTGLAAGAYPVTITGPGGTCTKDTIITLASASGPSITNITFTAETCSGQHNGTATVTASGGTGALGYTWSNTPQGTTSAITGLTPGIYRVTVIDASLCSVSASVTIPNGPDIGLSVAVTQPSCNQSNGSITLTPTPAGTYAYHWATNASTQGSISSLASGAYAVTITAPTGGCTKDTIINLAASNAPTISNITSTVETCLGQGNGTATVTASGGTGALGYAWSNTPQGTTATITGLTPNTYTVIVTDAATCSVSATVAVAAGPVCCSIGLSVTATQPTCGSSNGSINLNVQPASNYSYTWSDAGPATASRTGLAAGAISVTITNVATPSCTKDTTINLNSNSTLNVAFSNKVDPTCANNDGSITATLSGGTAPYSVTIDTGGTPQTITVPFAISQTLGNLHAGTVNVSVTDAAGCQASVSATLVLPTNCCQFVVSAAITQPACGQTNGGIALTTTNGSGNYSYNWSAGLGTTNAISSQGAGNYLVTITDNAYPNCFIDTSYTLNNPGAPVVDSVVITNETCFGLKNGTAAIYASGGTGTLTYLWASSETTSSVSGLAPGSDGFTVTDATGCAVPGLATIGAGADLATTATVTPPACGQNNAAINVNITGGGTSPYTYSIDGSNYVSNSAFNNVPSGNYDVITADAKGCHDTIPAVVPSLSNTLNVTAAATNITCFGANDGTVSITATGGNPAYTYVWNIAGSTNTQTALQAGNYLTTVTDQSGCSGTATASVTEPAALTVDLGSDIIVCAGEPVTVDAGSSYATYQWSSGEVSQIINPVTSAEYYVSVTNATGCSATDSVNVTFVPAPVVDLGDDRVVYEGMHVLLSPAINGNATGGTYNWQPDTLLSCITCIAPVAFAADTITYTLTYTDAYGCKATDNVTLFVLPVGELYWPNAFTPNGDGNNDFFLAYGSGVKQMKLTIFDRWGEKVFDAENANLGWDGTYKGQPLPMGVYIYHARVVMMNDVTKNYQGSVTLVR